MSGTDQLAAEGSGSLASADNRAIWLGLLGSSALARRETWELVFRFLLSRDKILNAHLQPALVPVAPATALALAAA